MEDRESGRFESHADNERFLSIPGTLWIFVGRGWVMTLRILGMKNVEEFILDRNSSATNGGHPHRSKSVGSFGPHDYIL